MADSMVFYKSFYDAIQGLEPELRLEIYDAVMEYALYGEEPTELSLMANTVFTLIKPQIDANNRRKENAKKGGETGGRPKKEEKETHRVIEEKPIGLSDENPNVNVNDNVNVNVNENVKGGTGEKRKRFIPPTLDEVKAYCQERKNNVDPQKFFDYYEEGKWKDSRGEPVKNWKQKLITWEKKQPKTEPKQNWKGVSRPDIDFEELKRRCVVN